jgi:glycosyltransferase involved in cell wall biosynthesis
MFGWEFPPHNSGGLGTACLGLTKALCQEDVSVIFVLPKTIDVQTPYAKLRFADKGKNFSVRNVDVHLYPYLTSEKYAEELKRRGGIWGNSLIDEVRRYGLLARAIAEEEEFDVIHAHDWLSFLAGIEAKRVSGKPLVLHVHATEFDRTGGHGVNQEVYDIERSAMHEADQIIAVSGFTKDKIVRYYGIAPDKVQVVYNGVDDDAWTPIPYADRLLALKRGGKRIVLFVGRITIQKGPEYFVRAAKKVLDHDPNVLFVVSGSGDMQHKMMNEAAYLGMGDKLLFTGFLRGDELKALYRTSDVFVMSSISEPFGITPLEAIASGVPVIISKQSGVAEVLAHALKVDFWDVDEMANKILSVLTHPTLYTTLRDYSAGEVKVLNWKKAARKVIDIYRSLFE